jgi:hypothetical protein
MHKLLFILIFLTSVPLESMSFEQQGITIKGEVIAISNDTSSWLRINGYVSPRIMVRIEKPKELASFVCIWLSVPSQEYEKWYKSIRSRNRFRVQRRELDDGPLVEYLDFIDMNHPAEHLPPIPAWKRLPGREKIILPYNQPIMAFESLDWPFSGML